MDRDMDREGGEAKAKADDGTLTTEEMDEHEEERTGIPTK